MNKEMKYNPWVKEESNLTKEQWDTQQKWVQGFSHSRMPSQSERQEMSRPSKWNYDVADSSE